MDWTVRRAKPDDVPSIVKLTREYMDFLMPYTAGVVTTRSYIDQFMVAESIESYSLGGAVHFVPNNDYDIPTTDKVVSFLIYVKQVPEEVVDDFMSQPLGRKLALIGQVICPGKGSFHAILEEAKKQYDEIWCYMSVVGPSYESYIRYGFNLDMNDVREFWNVYKCDYSKFVLGKWKKGE